MRELSGSVPLVLLLAGVVASPTAAQLMHCEIEYHHTKKCPTGCALVEIDGEMTCTLFMCEVFPPEQCPEDTCHLLRDCAGQLQCRLKPRRSAPPECGGVSYFGQDVKCCPGLVRRCGKIAPDGACDMADGGYMGFASCLACGDDVCALGENRCNCPEDCLPTEERPRIIYRGSSSMPTRRPEVSGVLMNPNDAGDIPQMAQRLMSAYEASDAEACDRLPTPREQVFNNGCCSTRAPSRSEWQAYCRVLVDRAPQACRAIPEHSNPNLRKSCERFFKSRAEQDNDSPAWCLEQLGAAYSTRWDVQHCLSA